MHKNSKADAAGAAATDKVALYDIGEDEAGMRLDRWFRRRFPDLPQSHLNKIVRKGEVRVSGRARRRVDAARKSARPSACRRCSCRRARAPARGAPIRRTPRRSGR